MIKLEQIKSKEDFTTKVLKIKKIEEVEIYFHVAKKYNSRE